MPLPTDDLIVWASSDVNLPNLAGPNKVKPIDDLILKGWDFKQKPAADEFNYVLNNLGMHVSYLEESKTYTFSGDVTGTATSTGSDDVTFNVSVTDNSHNHTSANISDATSVNNSNTVVKRGASGEISVGDLTISKVGGVSTINFPATSNDAGYIKHSETNDVSRIQFSISDNNDSIDKFEFGNTEGGSFGPKFTIDANGTTNVESSVTATNFIGPLQGNSSTTSRWANGRFLTLSGDVGGQVWMDGSENVVLNTWVGDNSHNHTSANISDATSWNTPNMVVRRDINGDVAVRYVVGGLTGNALTATTLETPRTINGTSFNGGSNITTSSWGTSRTLTLAGDVSGSVSIDGSGNVTLNTSVSSTSSVSILTGTVANGGTIPLPSGYSEGQCRWMVSMSNDNVSGMGWDIQEEGAYVHYRQQVYTGGRVVTAQTYLGSNNSPPGWISSTANYIIIGVK